MNRPEPRVAGDDVIQRVIAESTHQGFDRPRVAIKVGNHLPLPGLVNIHADFRLLQPRFQQRQGLLRLQPGQRALGDPLRPPLNGDDPVAKQQQPSGQRWALAEKGEDALHLVQGCPRFLAKEALGLIQDEKNWPLQRLLEGIAEIGITRREQHRFHLRQALPAQCE